MENKLELSILMPALDEEKNILTAIENSIEALKKFQIDGEVIVINDGSEDGTRAIVEEALSAHPNLRLINHSSPKGIGGSFWAGVDQAKGGVAVLMPGDNENDPEEVFKYFPLMENVDIIIPFVYNKKARSMFRRILSAAYRFIINNSFIVNFNYTNGTILFRSSLLKKLNRRSDGFFFLTDILIRLVKRGHLFAEVPYRINQRAEGISTAISFSSLLQVAKGYLRLIWDIYFNKKGEAHHEFANDSRAAQNS